MSSRKPQQVQLDAEINTWITITWMDENPHRHFANGPKFSHRVDQDVRAGRAVRLLVKDDVHKVPSISIQAHRNIEDGRSRWEKLTSISCNTETNLLPFRLIRSKF